MSSQQRERDRIRKGRLVMNFEEIRNRLHYALTFGAQFPIVRKASEMQRDLLLRAMALGTSIHDPAPGKRALLEPRQTSVIEGVERYVRFDEAAAQLDGKVKPLVVENQHIIRSSYEFGYQPWDEPKLEILRERFELEQVMAPGETELERMVLLRNWGRSQWKRSDWQPRLPDFDIVAILERNARNTDGRENDKSVNYTPCSFFPPQFVQLLAAMGHTARYVSISHESVEFHGMTEVWSNQHAKWIAMDADLNLYYERHGEPYNLYQTHNLRWAEDPLDFEMVRGRQTSGDGEGEKPLLGKDFFVSYHTYFRTELRNDWFTNHYFRGHPKRSEQATLYYADPRLPPPRPWSSVSPVSNRLEDFYWTINQVEIHVDRTAARIDPTRLPLLLRTLTPNFDAFEIEIDDRPTIRYHAPTFDWALHPGENTLQTRPVNQAGIKGVTSKLVLLVA